MPFSTDPARRRLEFEVADFTSKHRWGPVQNDSTYVCTCGVREYWPGRELHERIALLEFLDKLSALPDPDEFARRQQILLTQDNIGDRDYRVGALFGDRDTLRGMHEFRAAK